MSVNKLTGAVRDNGNTVDCLSSGSSVVKKIARKHNRLSFDLRPLEVTVEAVGRLNEGLIIVERGYQTKKDLLTSLRFVYNSLSIALVDLVVMCGFLFVLNFS